MGITCSFSSATSAQVRLLLRNPRLVAPFLSEEGEVAYRPSWFQRLTGFGAKVPPEILAVEESMRTDIDKAWHGIHFLLTGRADEVDLPAGFLLSGGVPLSRSSRLLSPGEVVDCQAFLERISDEQLEAAFDADEMVALDLYPNIWSDSENAIGYLMAHVETLRAVLRDCVEEQHGLVVTIA